MLTRLLPFIYEADHLGTWEERFFWGARKRKRRKQRASRGQVLFDGETPKNPDAHNGDQGDSVDVRPLAEELIDTAIDLLYCANFTVPEAAGSDDRIRLTIWQSGVGCNTAMTSTKDHENNRLEVLRLLLTLASKSMYTPPSEFLVL